MAYQTLTQTVLPKNFTANNFSTIAATAVTASGSGNGVTFANDGSSFLIVNNAGSDPVTLTVKVGSTILGLGVTNPTVSVAAGAVVGVGPFDSAVNQAGSGQVEIDFSANTDVTVCVAKLGGTR